MEVAVLGPAQVHRGAEPVDLGTRKQRALLAALALYAGRPVSVDAIVDLLWGDEAPPAVTGTLQAYVAGLRKALEPDRAPRTPATILVTVGAGYALRVPPDQLDVGRFSRAVTSQHQRLAPVAGLVPDSGRTGLDHDQLTEAVAALDAALDLWRGEPYLELDDAVDARAERTRLGELQLIGLEDRALARLWLGEQATVAAELESLTSAYPLRERLWGLRALALARAGRQADALEVLRTVRALLDDELGLEPSSELRALQTAVLRQEAVLEWTVAAPQPTARSTPRTRPRRQPPAPRAPGWPMVGRDDQLATLVALLDVAESGQRALASLVGDPGIGKSRLAGELSAIADERGLRVVVGRCSQDDGAPPLWPWVSVLGELDHDLPTESDHDQVSQFAVWEGIVATILDTCNDQPLLLILDDLHWADVSSLRVLRLLIENDRPRSLMVLGTWRSHPPPTGALADVAEMLARAHAVRIELTGLSADQAADVVERLVTSRPTGAEADALLQRTDGNPFFLVEYARLAAERGDLGRLLAEANPPTAVHDVLTRRLARLPDSTHALLRLASVIGRQFDLAVLAASSGLDEDPVLDGLEPAQQAGLVREEGIDRFSFAHALVRDTAYTEVSESRRARLHAQVAQAMTGRPGRESELALHWLAAGPGYADRAWRAAVAAAAQARRVHAHERSVELLEAALAAMDGDPGAGPRERYDLLMDLADGHRWTGMWPQLIEVVGRAIDLAESLGDLGLVAGAATAPTVGAIWQSAPPGQVNERVVAALRSCLERLPAQDGTDRCRVMLSLANELYYGATLAERMALVEEALAMAQRLGDKALLLHGNLVGFAALWVSATAEERLARVAEAMVLARGLGHEQSYVVAATMRTVVEAELGLVERMWQSWAHAMAEAERLHLPYGQLVLESLALPWLAMAGDFDAAEAALVRIIALDNRMSLEHSGDATAGALIGLRMWQGRGDEVTPLLAQMEGGPMPVTAIIIVMLLRSGRAEEAAAHYASHPINVTADDWFSTLNWGMAAEVALAMDDHPLAADVYARLAPYAGHICAAGSSNGAGPVDAFLALAAAAVGERALATTHADRADELMEQWRIPVAGQWLRRYRDRFGF